MLEAFRIQNGSCFFHAVLHIRDFFCVVFTQRDKYGEQSREQNDTKNDDVSVRHLEALFFLHGLFPHNYILCL